MPSCSATIHVCVVNVCVFHLTELMVEVMATTSMSLDTTYTAKSVRGLVGEMKNNPNRFKGKNILFIHTGQFASINAEFTSIAILHIILRAYFRPIGQNCVARLKMWHSMLCF